MDKIKVTFYLPPDLAHALHHAAWAAGGHGQKNRIVVEALRAHPEIKRQLETEKTGSG